MSGSPFDMKNKILRYERGAVAIFLVMLLSVMAALTMVFQLSASSRGETRRHLNMATQADGVARTGLDETLAWFRRQEAQPVYWKNSVYAGRNYTYADQAFMPDATDSLRPDIGLVQEYPLSQTAGLWARFEVRRQAQDNTDPAADDPRAAHDITGRYFGVGEAGRGLCWSVEAAGIVFKPRRPVTPGTAYNPAGDEIIARSRASTEFRRLEVKPPAYAALIVLDGKSFNPDFVTTGVNLEAGTDGVALAYYAPPEADTDFSPFMETVPVDKRFKELPEEFSVRSVFGTTLAGLKGLSDFYVRGSALPERADAYPEYGLIFIDGDAVFDDAHPFPKSGLVVVNGRMEKVRDVDVNFTGALYVTGDLVVQGPGHFSGVVMAEKRADIRGDHGQMELWQDLRSVTYTTGRVEQYRQDRSARFVLDRL
jgi:hypothetical protein